MDDCLTFISEWAATFESFDAFEDILSNVARLPVGRLVSTADTLDSD